MLTKLSIENFALIEQLEIEWKSGLTTLTGETGSGKSIVLGSLGLVLGGRSDSSTVRTGCNRCTVEATFTTNATCEMWLLENELEVWPELILRREVSNQGRSRAFVNDTPVSATSLKEIGEALVDLHGQDSTKLLLKRENQLTWLDAIGKHTPLLEAYHLAFHAFERAKNTFQQIEAERAKPQTDRAYLMYQLNELEQLAVSQRDWPGLQKELNELENSATIQEQLNVAWKALENEREEGSMLDKLHLAQKSIALASEHKGSLQSLLTRLSELQLELKDIITALESEAESVEKNPHRLVELSNLLDEFQRILLKHGLADAKELIQFEIDLQLQLELLGGMEERYEQARKNFVLARESVLSCGRSLMESRKSAAAKLQVDVLQLLAPLKMPNARLEFLLEESGEPDTWGLEQVQLLFSANPGADLAPLAQVASGGEKSRLMLAFKSAQATITGLPTIVLDEIDTGVSGDIAERMGFMMKDMAQSQQVIAVTHLPQVAAHSEQHLRVSKETTHETTRTQVTNLVGTDRVSEIASLLSGEVITDAARENAKSLLGLS
jgi:DNA repair protein RecN (Recombination protein N)